MEFSCFKKGGQKKEPGQQVMHSIFAWARRIVGCGGRRRKKARTLYMCSEPRWRAAHIVRTSTEEAGALVGVDPRSADSVRSYYNVLPIIDDDIRLSWLLGGARDQTTQRCVEGGFWFNQKKKKKKGKKNWCLQEAEKKVFISASHVQVGKKHLKVINSAIIKN